MKKVKRRLIYLLYLLLPLAYYLIGLQGDRPASDGEPQKDYVFLSVRSNHPCRIVLSDDEKTLSAWDINSMVWKNLQFVGEIKDSAGLKLSLEQLDTGDTVFVSGLHLYRDNMLYTAGFKNFKKVLPENAVLKGDANMLAITPNEDGQAVAVQLSPSPEWETANQNSFFPVWLVAIFIITGILLLVFTPSAGYFVVVTLLSLFTMFACRMAVSDTKGRAEISTPSGITNAEVYYHHSPFFSPEKRFTSEGPVTSFGVPVNFKQSHFLRIDLGEGQQALKDIRIMFKLGFFRKTYDIEKLRSRQAVFNDVETGGARCITQGADPYIMLTSSSFLTDIHQLIFLHSITYLFVGLAVFLLLLCINPFAAPFFEKRFHPTYLMFLLLPVTFLLLVKPWGKAISESKPPQLYFSASTSAPAVISLYNGRDSLTSWNCQTSVFHYCHYKGPLDSLKNLTLSVSGLNKGDTLQMLSVNLFHNGEVYDIRQHKEDACGIRNADVAENSEGLQCFARDSTAAVVLNLLPYNSLHNSHPEDHTLLWALLLFVCGFMLVLLMKPGPAVIAGTSVISVFLMCFYYWVCRDIQFRVYLSATSPVRHTQLFFSPDPTFELLNRYNMDCDTSVFLAQVDLKETPFMRFDVADSTPMLSDFKMKAKTGLMQRVWNFGALPYNQLLLNDMVLREGRFYVSGTDPYVAFSTMQNHKSIRQFIYLREQVFVVLSLLIFLLLLLLSGRFALKTKRHFMLSLVFLLLISYGLVLRLFNSDSLVFMSEMRVARPKPVVQFDSTKVFLRELDAYIKDQIPGRNSIVVMNNLIEYTLFRQLLNNRNVHFGKDGWMFFIGDNCRENYENRTPLTQEQLETMKKVLVSRHEWLKERGIKFYLVFPPMAYFVYEEKVGPRLWRYNKKTKLEQLLEYLKKDTELNIIDIYNPLMEVKKKSPVRLYYKDNTHWNFFGSYVAYRAMIQYIRKDFTNMDAPLPLNNIKWSEYKEYYSDFFKLVGIYKYYKYNEVMPVIMNEPVPDTIMPKYPELVSPVYPFTVINRHKKDKPNMLLYGDSFSGYQLTYLAYNFFCSTYLWTPLFYPSIIEKEHPDIVIQEMADYTIMNILNPNPPLPEMKDTVNNTLY